jgi:hypothetical protein
LPGLRKVNALAIADFNADGRPDLAAVNGDPGELLILAGLGWPNTHRRDGKRVAGG